jgi:hypothetical protein
MSKVNWAQKTDLATVTARSFGRNRLNAQRRRKMWRRRFALLALVNDWEIIPRGFQTQMAEKFGVSRCVISKDMAWVMKNRAPGFVVKCSLRGRLVTVTAENPLPVWMRRKRDFMRLMKSLSLNANR